MLNKRLKTQGSPGILSMKDLDTYFNTQKFRKAVSPSFSRSQCQSPKSSRSQSQQDKSQKQTGTQNLQEQIQRLHEMLNMQKFKSQTLATQNLSLVNQIHVHQTLISQLKDQKQKIIDQVHYIRKSYEQIQQERNKLLIEAGKYRNQVNSMRATLDINQQQISTLQHTNRKIIDELNFQKQMLADYKQQNTSIKSQFKNITNAFLALKQLIKEQKQRFIRDQKQVIDRKINELKQSMFNFRDQVRAIASQLRQIDLQKQDVFSFVRRLKLTFQSTRTQLNIARSFTSSFDETQGSSSLFITREAQYKRTIQSNEQKIKSLTTELTNLRKKYTEVCDQMAGTGPQVLASTFHTNTNYLNKVMKQNHRQIQQIKQLIQIKDEQIQRLRQSIELSNSSSNAKNEQIERLQVLLKLAQNNPYNQLNGEIEQLKLQKMRLDRRIEQLTQVNSTMKAQIGQKDRIILNYVQKSKIK